MKILILGANGQLARNTTRVLLRDTDAEPTLYLRRASRLKNPDPTRARNDDEAADLHQLDGHLR